MDNETSFQGRVCARMKSTLIVEKLYFSFIYRFIYVSVSRKINIWENSSLFRNSPKLCISLCINIICTYLQYTVQQKPVNAKGVQQTFLDIWRYSHFHRNSIGARGRSIPVPSITSSENENFHYYLIERASVKDRIKIRTRHFNEIRATADRIETQTSRRLLSRNPKLRVKLHNMPDRDSKFKVRRVVRFSACSVPV